MLYLRFTCFCLFFAYFTYASPLLASPTEGSHDQPQADLATLAKDSRWLSILQFSRSDWHNTLQSEVDTESFFFADNGQTDALAELKASIQALGTNTDQQCRYPARARWLFEQGLIPTLRIGIPHCKALNDWLTTFKADTVSVIFPAAYLNSPSSMFGHMFLRVNQQGQTDDNQLLAKTINYAANVNDNDPEFLFAYKGLFGGYPGVMTVLPYYQKTKEYSDIEHRDIWEYHLNLTSDEIRWLLLSAWELLPIQFDYFFFDENCAYRILMLLEVARPTLKITQQFDTYAIPSDTVRAVVDNDLVSSVQYRPSQATRLQHKINALPGPIQQLALAAARPNADIDAITQQVDSVSDRAAILELAFDTLRYRAQQEKIPRDKVAEHSLVLLKERSKLTAPSPFSSVPEPKVRDDQGHDTFLLSLSAGNNNHIQTTCIRIRPSYHDLMDPIGGYPKGAQIKFLDTVIDVRETGTIKLDHFTALNITSLTPRNDFFKPLSWRVDVGLYRSPVKTHRHVSPQRPSKKALFEDPLMATTTLGAGRSYAIDQHQFYGLLETQLQYHHDMPSNYAANLGLHVGWLFYHHHWQQKVSLVHRNSVAGYDHNYSEFQWNLSYHLDKNLSLFGELKTERSEGQYFHAHQLGVKWRF